MLIELGISLLGFLVLLSSACGFRSGAGQNPARGNAWQTAFAATTKPSEVKSEAKSAAGPALIDVCALLQKSEIASVQGVQVQQTQPTSQKYADLDISQCYYTAISADGTKNLSVYVQVIQRDPKSARRDAVKEFWDARFGRESKENKETKDNRDKRRGEREEEEINPPVPVAGVGDEAVWLASNRGGALFVRKKEKLVRVSVGGTEDAKAEIEKSKTLAKKALARLM